MLDYPGNTLTGSGALFGRAGEFKNVFAQPTSPLYQIQPNPSSQIPVPLINISINAFRTISYCFVDREEAHGFARREQRVDPDPLPSIKYRKFVLFCHAIYGVHKFSYLLYMV